MAQRRSVCVFSRFAIPEGETSSATAAWTPGLTGAGAWFAEGVAWLQQPVEQSEAELVIGQSVPISLMPIAHCEAARQAQTAIAGCARRSATTKAAMAGNDRLITTTLD